jgi:mono/diheme cytochrome c family protein
MSNKINILVSTLIVMVFTSCQQPGKNKTGSEYMPDMGHSVAYEANAYGYYDWNRWGGEPSYYKNAQPRNPVANTIARGYAGKEGNNTGESGYNAKSYTMNGSVPYYYKDTEEERTRAMQEIVKNPYPITEKGLTEGKALYTIFCAICHGDKGDGAGYLVRDDGKYQAQPANFLKDEFIASTNGRYYHSIMYGKNVMGGYSDKLSYKERWNVIHYIRSLQAASKSLAYNDKENTLNTIDMPFANLPKATAVIAESMEMVKKEAGILKPLGNEIPVKAAEHGKKH